jgi:acyl carrier protein
LEQLGLRPFTTDDALNALGELIDGEAPACIAFADVDWKRWASHAELAKSPRFSEMAGVAGGGDKLARFRREMSAIPGPERLGALEARLTRALAAVLGEKPESIPLDRSLESLGVDSLMAVELSLSLEQEMGVRLPTSLLMQGPTVKVLAQHIIDEAFGLDGLDEQDIDQLSEEEADALLAMLAQSGEIDLAAIQA